MAILNLLEGHLEGKEIVLTFFKRKRLILNSRKMRVALKFLTLDKCMLLKEEACGLPYSINT